MPADLTHDVDAFGVFPRLHVSGPDRVAGPHATFDIAWNGAHAAEVAVGPTDPGAPRWTWTVLADRSPIHVQIDLRDMSRGAAHVRARTGQAIPVHSFAAAATDDRETFRVWPCQEWGVWVHVAGVQVGGAGIVQCCHDQDVLRRHYTRPQHMHVYSVTGPPPATQEGFHRGRLRQLKRLLDRYAPSARVVVDIGSGTSLVRAATGGRHDFTLVCTDGDQPAVRYAREHDDRCVAIESTPDRMPLRSAIADFVYAGEVIEHVPDPIVSLVDWARVLRPGGVLVVTTPQSQHLLNRLRRTRLKDNREHLYEWTWHELRHLAVTAGFEIIGHEGLWVTPVVRWRGQFIDPLTRVKFGRATGAIAHAAAEAGRIPKIGKRLAYNQALVLRHRPD